MINNGSEKWKENKRARERERERKKKSNYVDHHRMQIIISVSLHERRVLDFRNMLRKRSTLIIAINFAP